MKDKGQLFVEDLQISCDHDVANNISVKTH